jgi:hypothetical protein
MKRIGSALLALAVLLVGAGTALSAGSGPYSLNVVGMQDVSGSTDVVLTVGAQSGATIPAASQHILLKSFDTSGLLRWAKNVMNYPLAPSNGSSSATLTYTDMLRHQPVAAHVQVRNARGPTYVLDGSGSVLLRPDLTVSGIQAPSQVRVGQAFNVTATIRELNGDLGGAAVVTLNEGGTMLDRATGVALTPLSSAAVVFSTRFSDPGTYTLTVDIPSVVPADYDSSNNSASVTVEVVNDVQPMAYYLYYYDETLDYHYQSYSNYGQYVQTQTEVGKVEQYYEYLYSSQAQMVSTVDQMNWDLYADGTLRESWQVSNTPLYFYDGGCYTEVYGSASPSANANVYFYYQAVNYNCDGTAYQNTYMQADRVAADYVYTSEEHDTIWGTVYYSYSYPYVYGQFLHARDSVQSRLVVQAGGVSQGGTSDVAPVSGYPYSYAYSYSSPDGSYGYTYSNSGIEYYGYASGMTTP